MEGGRQMITFTADMHVFRRVVERLRQEHGEPVVQPGTATRVPQHLRQPERPARRDDDE